MTAPPIQDGAVLVDDAGRIAAVGPHAAVPSPPGATALAFPKAVLVPGLINCHTHLELTHLAGKNSEREFPRWLNTVRRLREETGADALVAAAEQGVRDGWTRGITCVADTGSSGAPLEALAHLGGRGIYYHETFGPDPAQCVASLAELSRRVAELRGMTAPERRLGVSPHAPYTVSADLYRGVAALAQRERLPVALHLAESVEETRFVREGAGPFADAHAKRGIPVKPRGVSPVRYLLELDVLEPGTGWLAIHCVQIDDDDVRALADHGVAVAACPRSNRAHGHGESPFARLVAAGVSTGLGTDSVVSVADLDVWAEAAAVGLRGSAALQRLTLEGARALGWDGEIGSLDRGKAADLAVFSSLAGGPALLTVVAGRVVYGA